MRDNISLTALTQADLPQELKFYVLMDGHPHFDFSLSQKIVNEAQYEPRAHPPALCYHSVLSVESCQSGVYQLEYQQEIAGTSWEIAMDASQ